MPRLYPPAVAALALLVSGCASPCAPPTAPGPGGPMASFGTAGGYTDPKPQDGPVASGQPLPTRAASQPSEPVLGLPIGSEGMVCKDGVCEIPPPYVTEEIVYPRGDDAAGTVAVLQQIQVGTPSPSPHAKVPLPPKSPACWQFAAAIGTGLLSLAGFAWLIYRKQ